MAAVAAVLRSDWLTTGPAVERFEHAMAEYTGAAHAVAVSSGTAALHTAMYALGIGPGDEVIVPALTFAATANAVVYCGGTPVFADVEADTLLLDPASVARNMTVRTRAVAAVDYAGQPCDYEALRKVIGERAIALVADASHSLGARYHQRKVGTLADLSTFSFHPVKHITTGEGGMVTTNQAALAGRMRTFRNHGITSDHRQRAEQGSFSYEMVDLGYNYRISDLQCALGASQLGELPGWLQRREAIAAQYDELLAPLPHIQTLGRKPDRTHAYHLYVLRVRGRNVAFAALRERGIGANVHYRPVYLHPFYRERFGHQAGLCPVAEAAYEEILSIPMFPAMEREDVERVVNALREATEG